MRGRCPGCGSFTRMCCPESENVCRRPRSDGLPVRDGVYLEMCDCVPCQAARYVRLAIARGQLSPEAAEGARAVVRAIGGDAS